MAPTYEGISHPRLPLTIAEPRDWAINETPGLSPLMAMAMEPDDGWKQRLEAARHPRCAP